MLCETIVKPGFEGEIWELQNTDKRIEYNIIADILSLLIYQSQRQYCYSEKKYKSTNE